MPAKKNKPFNYKIFLVNRKFMAISIVLGTVSAMLVFLAIIPQFQESLKLNSEYKKEAPRLKNLKKKLVELQNIQFTPEFAQKEIVDDALPSNKPLLELLTSLNTIAVTNGVLVEDFSLNPGLIASNEAELQALSAKKGGSSGDGVDTLNVEMTVTGTFDKVGTFLIDLEKISPFTTINTLSLNSRNRGDDFDEQEKDMQAKITTKSYFFTQAVIASVEAPLPELNKKEQDVLRELANFSSSDLPEQIEITGGGLEDLFEVDPLQFE